MATHNIAVQFQPEINALVASPDQVTAGEGDELVITNTWFKLAKLILSKDAIGRLEPIPDAVVAIGPNETVRFQVANLANRAYEIQVRPTGFSNAPPADENTASTPHPIIRFLETRIPVGTGVGGGLEEFP